MGFQEELVTRAVQEHGKYDFIHQKTSAFFSLTPKIFLSLIFLFLDESDMGSILDSLLSYAVSRPSVYE